ncbi:Protein F16B3.3, isoform b [Aphelenchoides besseyi]|nr:Protein F16B3.3, isoform b [Aphelenchoides besseyi]
MRFNRNRNVLIVILWILITTIQTADAYISCYSCANDWIVWNWRHYFLKRNYHISQGDNLCASNRDFPETATKCHTSCFILFINGTDKQTGQSLTLGVSRGCSGQFLTDEQYVSRSLGVQSRLSESAHRLPRAYDKFQIFEHWCFCASDYCNVNSCYDEWRYSNAYGYAPLNPQRRYQISNGHDRRRSESEYYNDYMNAYWNFYNLSYRTGLNSLVILFPLVFLL